MSRGARTLLHILIGLAIATLFLPAVAVTVRGLREDIFQADVGVVYGASLRADGTPTKSLEGRLDMAIELYNAGIVRRLIVSGGRSGSGADEARAMQRYLVSRGVPWSAVVQDTRGENTRATSEFAARWARDNGAVSALAITQFYHVPRCVWSLKDAGIERVGCAYAKSFQLIDLLSLFREVPAIFAYSLGIK